MKEIVLVGNPNTGKTTLFNTLTSSNEHTGNWHGVTVDSKCKKIQIEKEEFSVIDLPGVYSLTPLSFEEKVTSEYLYNNKEKLVINIVDINNLYRNLYLTIELFLLKLPMILVINKTSKDANVPKKFIQNIEQKYGIKALVVDASSKADIKNLQKNIIDYYKNTKKNNNYDNFLSNVYDGRVISVIKEVCDVVEKKHIRTNICKEYLAIKCIENDYLVLNRLKLTNEELSKLYSVQKEINVETIAGEYYAQINLLLGSGKKTKRVYGKSRLDKYALNRFLCLPIFFAVLILIFYLTFFSVGATLSSGLCSFIENKFGVWVLTCVKGVTNNIIVIDFFSNAIISGLGTIFSFLPQVVMLYVCLGVLEDSGYLSRVAFSLDDIFSRVGLSGKGVYTLLMGFGCSTSACLTARTMENKNSKIKTAMLSPYMSCSAKLPIYAVIGSAFFGASNVFVIFLLYLLGVVIALMLSVFYEKTFLRSEKQSFIMEFPPYRLPKLKRLFSLALVNIKQFLIRVGSLLISVNVIIWILTKFSFGLRYVDYVGGKSIVAVVGRFLAPIFVPLGFGNWGAVSALLAGLVAKEVIVSTIGIINGVPFGAENLKVKIAKSLTLASSVVFFTPASAISFMVFCLLYSPCFATIGVLKREIGIKWTIISIVVQFVIAYIVSLVLYNTVGFIMNNGILLLIVMSLFVAIITYSLYKTIQYIINRQKCSGCPGCNKK